MNPTTTLYFFGILLLFTDFSQGTANKLDILKKLKSGEHYEGITQTSGASEGDTAWRFRPYSESYNVQHSDFRKMTNQMNGTLSMFIVGKQIKNTVGTLLQIVSSSQSLLSVVSDLSHQRLTITYRIVDSQRIHEVSVDNPFVDKHKWHHVLLVLHQDSISVYSGCDIFIRRQLDGIIDLHLPSDADIKIGQSSNGNMKYIGFLQEFWIYPSKVDRPWKCQLQQETKHINVKEEKSFKKMRGTTNDEPPMNDIPSEYSERIEHLEEFVKQLSTMMEMLKVQIAEMTPKIEYLEGCECLPKQHQCEYKGKLYDDGERWETDLCHTCLCKDGIVSCDLSVDKAECIHPCSSSPCPLNTQCVEEYTSYTCVCPNGQQAPDCYSNINMCHKPAEYGTCDHSIPMYYYNVQNQRCETFIYSGCGGYDNKFNSIEECEDECVVGACCHRQYARTEPGSTFLSFTILMPGFSCQVRSLNECRKLGYTTVDINHRSEVVSFRPGQRCLDGQCGLADGCIYGSELYQPTDSFQLKCQQCSCQASGNIHCRCTALTMRKEIRDMTRLEVERFHSAVQKLSSNTNIWKKFSDLYKAHVMHANGPMFLTWHRIFLRRVEQQLQETDCNIFLPYFDFTTDTGNFVDAVIWQPNYFGGDGNGDCVPDSPFNAIDCMRRNFNITRPVPSMIDVYLALASDDFTELSQHLQSYAGYIHEFIGGDMATANSPYDPIFLVIHSYIDMLYWRWQNKPNNLNNFPEFLKTIPMVPFNIQPQDTLDNEKQLCVTYSLPTYGDPCNGTTEYDDDRFEYVNNGDDVFGVMGYDRQGYDRRGWNRYGYNRQGYSRDGYDVSGYNRRGYDRYGFDHDGFDERGYDRDGYDRNGNRDTSDYYSDNGYNVYCFDRHGFNPDGYDQHGYTIHMYDEDYCTYAFHGPHIIKTSYRVQQLLYKHNKNFLQSIGRTCEALEPHSSTWYDQTWILNRPQNHIHTLAHTRYPDSVTSQLFCFDVETLVSECVCEKNFAECLYNPCDTECPSYPHAVCHVSFCQQCHAIWINNGQVVDCNHTKQDPCNPNPCINGGTCNVVTVWTNQPEVFVCQCILPYTGEHCEREEFDICILQLNEGDTGCGVQSPRWYFDMITMTCHQFMYKGCHGNGNNFATTSECTQSCINGACCWRTLVQSPVGYDMNGYDRYGFNIDGVNRLGLGHEAVQFLDSEYDIRGYNTDGFDVNGCDRHGYDMSGYNCYNGFNLTGYNRIGEFDGRTIYDTEGYNKEGFNRAGFNCHGIDKDGYNYFGVNAGYIHECVAMTMMECQDVELQPNREVVSFTLGKRCEDTNCGDSCGCNLNGHRYRIGESFEYGCQTCKCSMTGTVHCSCNRTTQRREIRDLTPDEMKRYQNAIKVLYPSKWQYFVNLHADSLPQAYGSDVFLPWHRYFLRAVEMELKKIDCDITIPYFDWTIDAGSMSTSAAWQANNFGGNGDSATGCVLSHPFKDHSWGPCLQRRFNTDVYLPDNVNIQLILNEPSYENFRLQLESASGLFRLWVGGHMATPYSPYDPMFLSHFAYIDMIWHIWQSRTSASITFPPILRYSPMSPWKLTPDDVMSNEKQFCVAYIYPTQGVLCNNTNHYSKPFDDQFNIYGYNQDGYSRDGFDDIGYDMDGFNTANFNRDGFDRSGYDVTGYNRYGVDRYGSTPYDLPNIIVGDLFDIGGYNQYGFDRYGFDRVGRDAFGFTRDGYDQYYCNHFFNGPFYLLYYHSVFQQLLPLTDLQLFNITRICPDVSSLPDWWMTKNWLVRHNQVERVRFVEKIRNQEHHINDKYVSRLTSVTDEYLWLPISPDERFCFEIHYYSECPIWQPPITCSDDLCAGERCPNYPYAVCKIKNCGQCEVQWYDGITGDPLQCITTDCTDENGISYHDSSVWQLDSCTSCTCQHSVITCIPLPCPDTSCSHPSTPHGHCCPLCQGCLYLGIEVENGEIFSPNGDPCSSCSCQSGTVFCSVIECSQVDCQHPVVSDGKCCPACAGCEYEGRILSNGESFHKDQCINCVCVHGTVTCQGPEDCPVLKCFDQYLPTGECCARCRNGCEYEGVEFANGDFFTPMSNPCLTCSCTMSIVRCNPMRCPDITCSHPIKLLGACCENCADGCFYDNMDYGIGETWTTLDGCKQCTCIDGNVDCVSQQICQVECQHGVLLPGDCCSQCTDCLYNGKTFSDGSTFVVNGETCTQCSCQSGTVQCTTQTCPHINCLQTHIPEGSCCPVCKDDGCVDNYGRRHENNDEWRHPVDNCVLCRCIGDTINCETEQCQPTCSHGVKKPELCCPVCQGCLYRGVEYLDGDDVNNGNPCSQCTCNSGTVDCIPIICPQVRCHNPTILPNECCPVCHECTYSQSTFQDGETFVDPRNPCLLCTCEAGVVDCNRLDLDCIPECSHPGRMVDVCCPVCDTCEYERRNYANGIAFNPDSGDVCDICFCKDGSVTCQTQVCEQLTCKNAVQKSDECCPVCEVCIADGIEHEEGESWESLADPCAVCTCLNSRTHCRHKECPIMPCKHAARMNSDCCPSCHNCDYDRRLFRNGQIFLDPLNQCQQCLCQDGSVECKHIECPVLNCPNQVTDQGECCPKCSGTDCEYNGHSYYNEETFSNPLDPCEDCLCMLGVVTCVRKSCQPAICPYPVIEDCCQLCDGCTYNGVTYRNGQTFSDFSDRCKDCICQYGHVNCVVTECDVQCSHPVTIDNACCPRCDACFYEGRRLAIGQIFTDPNDQCLICSCDAGNVECSRKDCERVDCSYPVQDECGCAICYDCLYKGLKYINGATQTDPDDRCMTCRCLDGSVECMHIECPVLNCPNQVTDQGECCPKCSGTDCEYNGHSYYNEETFSNPLDPCEDCLCMLGVVTCVRKSCQPAICPYPVIEDCCQLCDGCTYNGVTYRNGQTFSDFSDRCKDCICQYGHVNCVVTECDVQCSHPVTIDNACCPRCDACFYEGRRLAIGQIFTDPNDQCLICSCDAGNVECSRKDCERVDCSYPVQDECGCAICYDCLYKGLKYVNGETLTDPDDRCMTCRCLNGDILCDPVSCSTQCSHPVVILGECCPICTDCTYEQFNYENNMIFYPPSNLCDRCVCQNGNILCSAVECPPLFCNNPITVLGECCPTCQDCLAEGVEYREGDTWVSMTNPCLSCECQGGITMCVEIMCVVPDSCAQIMNIPGQCCPQCQGCIHNGIVYSDGETFSPSGDPCESCNCENSNLKCFRQTCPSFSNCPEMQPAADGECCAQCKLIPVGSNCTEDNIGIKMKPFQDPCYVCECKDASTWECLRMTCPTLNCPPQEQFTRPDDCCARCDRCYVDAEDRSYSDGESWKDPSNECITCTCSAGVIECKIEVCDRLNCQQGFEVYLPLGKCCPYCRDINIPCQFGGITYQPKERWIKDECTNCECKAGEVRCVTTRCPPISCFADETPAITPGVCCPSCVSKPATCIAFGDPHYRTFDGKMIHFQGTCKYIMSMDCENQDYIVEVENDDRGSFGAVSWTQKVTVTVSGMQVDLGQSGLVQVNGQIVVLPYLSEPTLYIEMRAGNNIFINTNIGLKVHWDGKSYLEVSLPGIYSGKTCGLCGNFNSYPQDDLKMRSGQIVTDVAKFGNSWKVFDPEGAECEDAMDIDPCTEAGYRARKLANAKCAVLKSARFDKCHPVVPAEPYYASCVYDMCACGSDDSCLCDILSAYAAECRQSGVSLLWRSSSLCAIRCPEDRGLMFDECGPPCSRTCENKDVPLGVIEAQCFRPCIPGCQCPADKVLFDARCIDPEQCPPIIYGNTTLSSYKTEDNSV